MKDVVDRQVGGLFLVSTSINNISRSVECKKLGEVLDVIQYEIGIGVRDIRIKYIGEGEKF